MMTELWDLHLQGDHVRLRPLCIDDVQQLAQAAAENRQSYLYNPVPDGPEQARSQIDRAYNSARSASEFPLLCCGETPWWAPPASAT